MRRVSAPLLALVLLSAPLAAQTVRGRVLDAATGQPVAGATVTASEAGGRRAGRATAGPDGAFTIELRRAGSHRLSAERIGYQAAASAPFDVQPRETVDVELRLSTSEVALEPLRVTARAEPPRIRRLQMAGFYDREREGHGAFVRREDIEKVPTERMTDVLRRVPGVNLLNTRYGKAVIIMRAGGAFMGDCQPRVLLDGMEVFAGRPRPRPQRRARLRHQRRPQARERGGGGDLPQPRRGADPVQRPHLRLRGDRRVDARRIVSAPGAISVWTRAGSRR